MLIKFNDGEMNFFGGPHGGPTGKGMGEICRSIINVG